MINPSSVVLFSYVSFNLYAPETLGSGYSRAQVRGVIDADTAAQTSPDIATKHADIFSQLPSGTPDDYRAYPYLKLLLTDGNVIAIGLPWIEDSSFTVLETQTGTVVLPNISAADQARVQSALAALNLSGGFTFTLSSPNGS